MLQFLYKTILVISVLSGLEDEEGDAALEEQEALKLQRQMAEQLDDQDFGLDIFKVGTEALKLQRQMAEQLDDQDFGLDIFKVGTEALKLQGQVAEQLDDQRFGLDIIKV